MCVFIQMMCLFWSTIKTKTTIELILQWNYWLFLKEKGRSASVKNIWCLHWSLHWTMWLTAATMTWNDPTLGSLTHHIHQGSELRVKSAIMSLLKGNSGIFKPRPYFWHEIRSSAHPRTVWWKSASFGRYLDSYRSILRSERGLDDAASK